MEHTSTIRARSKVLALAIFLAAVLAVVPASVVHAVPATLVVTNTDNFGAGSLRQAIIDANSNGNPTEVDTIEFDIPATDPRCMPTTYGCFIPVLPELQAITQAVTIDGYSQPGASPNTLTTGSDAALKITLSGVVAGPAESGITITGPGTTVKGLSITSFESNGVEISGAGATGNRIEGNYIGVDTTGTVTDPNPQASGDELGNDFGVDIEGAPNNVIGGTSPAARNVISGNRRNGVYIDNSGGGDGNRIEGNYIGTDASGNEDLGNGFAGVSIGSGRNNVVGGSSAAARNLISGNDDEGVEVFNSITKGARILRNSIFDNGELGINLSTGSSDNVTTNDPDDADTGPNDFQNYPVIVSATTSGGTTTVQGTLNSIPDETFILQFYSSPTADPTGFGEGETYVGQAIVSTNAAGNATFSSTTTSPVAAGRVVTATATDTVTDNTSEFSRAVEVEGGAPPPPTSQCSDDVDNDGDSKTDFPSDPGCSSASDNTENSDTPPPQPQCSDGLDNDSDGQTDFPDDPGCESATDDSESPDPAVPACTITGTPGNDGNLRGTNGNDVICGLGGNDTINARGGDDTVLGGSGRDTINGGDGNDTLEGGGDNDAITGGSGSDDLFGEADDDILKAKDSVRGNDLADGGNGSDKCTADRDDTKLSCER